MIHVIDQIIVVAGTTHDNIDDKTPWKGVSCEEKVVFGIGLEKVALFGVFRNECVLSVDSRGNRNNVLVIVIQSTTDDENPRFQCSCFNLAR